MRVLVEGSGGSAGWPQPGCRCASCLRQHADGNIRMQSTIVVDGRIRLGGGDTGGEGTGGEDTGGGVTYLGATRVAAGYRLRHLADARAGAGGWDVTAPDGGRLLYPAGPGAVPVPPEDAAPYDVAFLDCLAIPLSSAGSGPGG